MADDSKDRLGSKIRDVEAAREDQWMIFLVSVD